MWAADDLGQMLEPSSDEPEELYSEILESSDPNYIVVGGAPEKEMEDRTNYAVTHYRNVQEKEMEPGLIAPEDEAEMIKERLNENENPEVIATPGEETREDEVDELGEVVEGSSEIHFFTSNYAKRQDRYIISKRMPETEATYFGMKADGTLAKKISEYTGNSIRGMEQIKNLSNSIESIGRSLRARKRHWTNILD